MSSGVCLDLTLSAAITCEWRGTNVSYFVLYLADPEWKDHAGDRFDRAVYLCGFDGVYGKISEVFFEKRDQDVHEVRMAVHLCLCTSC